MPRPQHYVPALSRFVVSVLYHEARRRKTPMTRLADTLLTDALRGSEGWREAESSQALREEPTTYRPQEP